MGIQSELPETPAVLLHGHTHRGGGFAGDSLTDDERRTRISGFSTIEEFREKSESLVGVKLISSDHYGTGRVSSIQDSPLIPPLQP